MHLAAVLLLFIVSLNVTAGDYSVRIIGGSNADVNEWPTMVQLMNETPEGTVFYCGGTLISDRWVLTAAHCFENESGSGLDTSITGRSVLVKSSRALGAGDPIAIQNIFPHEDYSLEDDDSDIALIELAQAVVNPDLQTLFSGQPGAGCTASIVGWGVTSNSESAVAAPILQDAEVAVVGQAVCNAAMNNQITDNMMCAGLVDGGIDSCLGDSGGPLFVLQDGVHRQAGVVSWGPNSCGEAGQYGVYARLSEFVDWISGKTGLIDFAPQSTAACGSATEPPVATPPDTSSGDTDSGSSGGGGLALSLLALLGLSRLRGTV